MSRIKLLESPRLLQPSDRDWPAVLADLREPPSQLYLAGRIPELSRAVGVVGTRFADSDALAFTHRLAAELTAEGCVVISGGAEGIDAAAHEGALSAGGETIAVLAMGLEQAYPAHHASLFVRIAQSGALISEFSNKPRPSGAWMFLKRNRLVAALAPTVVIVQAPARSGALSTARWAKQLKRRVLAVPAAPWDPRGTGCLELLSEGAEICTSAGDALSLPPAAAGGKLPKRRVTRRESNEYAALPAQARTVQRWLAARHAHPDEISAALDLPVAEVQEALLTLMLGGLCRQRLDGSYESTSGKGWSAT